MKTFEIVRYQQRLDNLFKKTAGIADLETQAHWARYLCILCSGFLEVAVREIYKQYALNGSNAYVANYVQGRLKGFQNPNMEKILQVTRSFNPQWEDNLKALVDGELKDAVDSIVSNRNRIAHGDDVGITYATIKTYYDKAVKVVEALEVQCGC